MIKKKRNIKINFLHNQSRKKLDFFTFICALMFPTVLDMNNIHGFVLVGSIGIISFCVIITTLNANKSSLSEILWDFWVMIKKKLSS